MDKSKTPTAHCFAFLPARRTTGFAFPAHFERNQSIRIQVSRSALLKLLSAKESHTPLPDMLAFIVEVADGRRFPLDSEDFQTAVRHLLDAL